MVNESNIEAIFAGMNTTEVVKTRSEKKFRPEWDIIYYFVIFCYLLLFMFVHVWSNVWFLRLLLTLKMTVLVVCRIQ